MRPVLFFIIALLGSCAHSKDDAGEKTVPSKPVIPHVEYIEVAYTDGWTVHYVTLFDHDSVSRFELKGLQYCKGKITAADMDTVHKYASLLLNTSVDTFYRDICHDCDAAVILIRDKGRTKTVKVMGMEVMNNIALKLGSFVGGLSIEKTNCRDTFCTYETLKKLLPPPVEVPAGKEMIFVPPGDHYCE